jgi:hypothetical protein
MSNDSMESDRASALDAWLGVLARKSGEPDNAFQSAKSISNGAS